MSAGRLAVALADAGQPQAIAAAVPVVAVTLLEDRAIVRRRGRVLVPPGRARLSIEAVAPVLVDKTLAGRLVAPPGAALPAGARVHDVVVRRIRITEDAQRPKLLAGLHERLRALQAARDADDHAARVLDGEIATLAAMAELTASEVAQDVGWGNDALDDAHAQLDALDERLLERTRERAAIAHARAQHDRDLDDLRRSIAAQTGQDAHAAAALVVDLINPGPDAVEADLQIDYLVPGALWRPCHSARLIEDPSGTRVELRTDACVWQATGEDWRDVEILLSTERPSLGTLPPALVTDRLVPRRRSATVAVQTRQQTVHTAGLGGEPAAPDVADDELPGIDDGGDVLVLRGRTIATIAGDGRPHRVPIGAFEVPCEAALVCVAELQPAVLLRSRQLNAAPYPLLAGPVELVRGSGLVGRTSIRFIAPGERFELGWGPDAALRVHREVEYLQHERRTLGSWTRKPRRVVTRLSNLGVQARRVEVTERIAVSEIEKVQVDPGMGVVADADGFVRTIVDLRGFGRDAVEVTWTLVVHDDVAGL